MDKHTLNALINLPGYTVEEILGKTETEIHVLMRPLKTLSMTCSFCGESKDHGIHSNTIVIAEDKNICDRRLFLHIRKRKYRCPKDNNKIHVESTPWLKMFSRFTDRFIKQVSRLTAITTNQEAGWYLGLDDETVYRMDKKYLKEQAEKKLIPIPSAINISVDETSYRKYHRYLTNVIDTDKKLLIWNEKGRKAEVLDKYYQGIGKKNCEKIESVAMDGARTYISSTSKYAVNALIVLDRFHIAQKLNNAVDAVRKQELRQARKQDQQEIIKLTTSKQRFILMKNKNNLTKKQSNTLEILCKLNQPIYKAMLLKESFIQIYSMQSNINSTNSNDLEEIKNYLLNWIEQAKNSNLEPFIAIAESFLSKIQYILNWFKRKISSAISEGFNNKIKRLKRMAYGYRDIEYFKLKIHQHCGLLNPRIAI